MAGAWCRSGVCLAVVSVVVLGAGCQDDGGSGVGEPEGSGTEGSGPAGDVTTAPAPTPTPSTPAQPSLLLPNMRSLPAEDLEIRQAGGGRELRFAAALANFGDGPLVLTPDDEPECPDGERHASQLVYYDVDGDGQFDPDVDTDSELFPAGCMVFHPDHDHWHFDASASYVLTRPGEDEPVVSSDKVSFCMRDSRRLPGDRWADAPETYGECERDEIQGITAGWADVYGADLAGQALELPDDADDGVYCLSLTADPFGLLEETDDGDNASVTAVEIVDDEIREAAADTCEPASRPG